ncbi:efflux RND transporter periplasmic adaptor subunit [Chelativorans sp. M5D2P16]|uniref:efflux RND transporter periplasmic adaptor subunit n=1 Tax=Chelativorans sp. M5D2P16 TaxID=3095678 RepID=UPI002ACAA23C|nr:efflux RND transporter periplasmic adaptor subunit [Chelativorans sp. M5D2P16]MDZ5699455.1 efflux RND transporter periplasmic adaptor subunit [Chelativorans sp. M5D2P16]
MMLTLMGCSDSNNQAGGAAAAGGRPVQVGYITLKQQDVPRVSELPGRVLASAVAEIRPRVNGIIRERVFKEASEIKEGDVLYRLDAEEFEAARAAADAAVARAEAEVESARSRYERQERLAQTNAVSEQSLEDARTQMLQAEADLASARANLQAAEIDLNNTTIRAPISGLIGTSQMSVGSLVTANQTDPLAIIRQIEPVHVDLVDSSANLLRLRSQFASGQLGLSEERNVSLILENGQEYGETGSVSPMEFAVSESTSTITARAEFPNPERLLVPGMFVRAQVEIGAFRNAVLVPQRATQRNSEGEPIAYVASAKDKAEQRILTVAGSSGNNWIVTGGVADGERLIVDGFQKFSEGAELEPVEVAIDENGVVRQDASSQDAATQPAQTETEQ